MKIMMVSSECFPFAKTGGLADVVYSLSKELAELDFDIKIVIPRYASIENENQVQETEDITVPVGFHKETVRFSSAFLSNSKVTVYFLKHPFFTNREGIYEDKISRAYRDNHRRFTLLNRSIFPLCRYMNWIPDIIHLHDWQTSLIPAYIKEGLAGEEFTRTKTILTIHNIGYQGIFSKHDIHTLSLPWKRVSGKKAQYNDTLNFLRIGILNSDRITTVSPHYAEEIMTREFGEGLEDILIKKTDILKGILNGADYSEWNPENDPYLPLHYSSSDMSNKNILKTMLQTECELPINSDKPLIGMVSRLTSQKGFYELCDHDSGILKKICSNLDVQIVILGTGEKWIEEELERLQKRYSNLKVFITFEDTFAHLIEAGSDFFLMPSRYEPCGLNQIYSLKFGTIPIVSNTGGLSDTVSDYFTDHKNGTGFYIESATTDSILEVTEKVVNLWYNDKNIIKNIRFRGMCKDFSWTESTKKYEALYQELISDTNSHTF